ncbi:hypothetical protein SLUN_37140 [Streptomyces lunaelactis]|uniref:Glucose-methanol-choline oxidoreductase C-terminal domain-containing protein n=1 Tax=Streptomyces lunaelactis TaxID=1535768 RepID=A0A2R4TCX6_9ACTN|nr:hypothetical protein SLUN_37140 [Streptomyces lunaelactis]
MTRRFRSRSGCNRGRSACCADSRDAGGPRAGTTAQVLSGGRRAASCGKYAGTANAGAVNPSLTAVANALRVGDHLVERLG